MVKIPLDSSSSGFVYDTDKPTYWTEKLSYIQCKILDALDAGGIEFRQSETADIAALDAYVQGEVTKYDTQEVGGQTISLDSLPEEDFLSVGGMGTAVVEARKAVLIASEDKSNALVSEGTILDVVTALSEIKELLTVLADREEILNIGSHVVWTKSMCVDEL